MLDNKKICLLGVALLLLVTNLVIAQDKPIGYWRALLPYDTAASIASNGNIIYCASGEGFYTYNPSGGNAEEYSKVEGMSDVGTYIVTYDASTSSVLIIYSNGNIDIFKDNMFYNIPDFKLATVAGAKNVNDVYCENGFAYISTSIGVLVVDLVKHIISENYVFYHNDQSLSINSFNSNGIYYYTLTSNGIYRAPKNSPDLQNFQIWDNLDSTHILYFSSVVGNNLYFSDFNNVYKWTGDSVQLIYATTNTIQHIDCIGDKLSVSEYNTNVFNGKILIFDNNNSLVDSILSNIGKPRQCIQLLDSSIWLADAFYGLGKKSTSKGQFYFSPPGPGDPNSYDIYAYNKNLWIAHGGYNQRYLNNSNHYGLSNLSNGKWKRYDAYSVPIWDSLKDFVALAKDETNGTLYAASFNKGLFELHEDGSYVIYEQNSILEVSIPNAGSDLFQVIGLGLDQSNNLWVTMFGSYDELYVKEKSTGNWYKYHISYGPTGYPYNGGQITIDNSGDAWFNCTYGGGIIGYRANGTFSNLSDDTSTWIQKGVGYGNLPSNNVYCIAIDKDDNLWVGTDNGIGIVYNASSCLTAHCEADIPIVQYDQYAGYLFAGQNVRTIAVDGANRKWVGTDNGVWLLSPDASKIVYRFTQDNSPLPSNGIQKIAIDKATGDVYIGTTGGVVSFRSTATEGGTANQNVLVFPNPVPSGYGGTIAIKGLVTDADVRITDIKGELVYKTTALGGQAVWNGLDYKGHRPETGVYLVFVSSADGSQTYTGKMVFMH